jgi:hypothetical protein
VSPTPEQKAREGWLIEQARRASAVFPPGKLKPWERPDWLISSASLGIEVTELPAPTVASFSGPQLRDFYWRVVRAAERRYRELLGPPADVQVSFKNEWHSRRDPVSVAEAVACFVRSNYPLDGRVVILDPSNTETWPDDLLSVRIIPQVGDWTVSAGNEIPLLSYHHLAGRIAEKNGRVKEYRRRLPPGWRLWLLVATMFDVLSTVSVPHEVIHWQFDFGFDKVWLYDWMQGVIELQRKPSVR